MDNQERIERNFTYHVPNPDDVWKMQSIRNHAKTLALLIDGYLPDCREKSLAITNLEQVSMWVNAGIVREKGSPAEPSPVEPVTGTLFPGGFEAG